LPRDARRFEKQNACGVLKSKMVGWHAFHFSKTLSSYGHSSLVFFSIYPHDTRPAGIMGKTIKGGGACRPSPSFQAYTLEAMNFKLGEALRSRPSPYTKYI